MLWLWVPRLLSPAPSSSSSLCLRSRGKAGELLSRRCPQCRPRADPGVAQAPKKGRLVSLGVLVGYRRAKHFWPVSCLCPTWGWAEQELGKLGIHRHMEPGEGRHGCERHLPEFTVYSRSVQPLTLPLFSFSESTSRNPGTPPSQLGGHVARVCLVGPWAAALRSPPHPLLPLTPPRAGQNLPGRIPFGSKNTGRSSVCRQAMEQH